MTVRTIIESFNEWKGDVEICPRPVLGRGSTKKASEMSSIQDKLAGHVGEYVVLSTEWDLLLTTPGTESLNPPPLSRSCYRQTTQGWQKSNMVMLTVCVCVCVCCHPIYSGRQVCGRTRRGHTGGRWHSTVLEWKSIIISSIFLFLMRFVQQSMLCIDKTLYTVCRYFLCPILVVCPVPQHVCTTICMYHNMYVP